MNCINEIFEWIEQMFCPIQYVSVSQFFFFIFRYKTYFFNDAILSLFCNFFNLPIPQLINATQHVEGL